MANGKEDHPFLAALPPTTDYITYLTLLEYNLDRTNVEVLQSVLHQDSLRDEAALIINIGWDLVGLLVPLLPASSESLLLIAKYGNPREVILKVAEAFESIVWEEEEEESHDDEEDPKPHDSNGDPLLHPALRTERPVAAEDRPARQEKSLEQLTTLSNMLGILHTRIRTNKPSRFAATTLGTVLSALHNVPPSCLSRAVESLLLLSRTMDTKTAPVLPPRGPASTTNGTDVANPSVPKAPDPEAEVTVAPLTNDAAIHRRLLQCFVTHLTAQYTDVIGNTTGEDDVPGLCWAPRELERYQPAQTVPGRKTWEQRLTEEEWLCKRHAILRDLLEATKALGTTQADLLQGAGCSTHHASSDEDKKGQVAAQEWAWNEDVLPQHPNDIYLSPIGCLHLLMAAQCDPSSTAIDFTIFPQHFNMLQQHVENGATGNVAHLDALLGLAIRSLHHNTIISPEAANAPSTETTISYLRQTATLSATSPSPSLRFAAHTLTTTVLRSCPSDALRLAFIRSVLEESPYPNLRISAVGWLKGCIVDANMDLFTHPHAQRPTTDKDKSSPESAQATKERLQVDEDEPQGPLFTTSLALTLLGPFLFPLASITASPSIPDRDKSSTAVSLARYEVFASTIPLYLTALNFYYFLLCAPVQLRQRLEVQHLHTELKVSEYLVALQDAAQSFIRMLSGPESKDDTNGTTAASASQENGILVSVMGGKDSEEVRTAQAELGVLQERTERVCEALIKVGL